MIAICASPLVRFRRPLRALALCTLVLAGCRARPNADGDERGRSASAEGGWHNLVNGTSLSGWHNFKTPGVAPTGWAVVDGELTRTGSGGDLTTDSQYGNFEMTLEWRVPLKGNSGVIYRIDPAAEVSYTSGPEMQILDDAGHPDGKSQLTAAGSDYGVYPAPLGIVKPAMEWNSARLLVQGNHVEHWLNGVKVVDYELGSPDWAARVARAKFAQWSGYGRASRGFIALQDHGNRVAFRNIRLRELP